MSTTSEGVEQPQCVLCCRVLSNESMKPSKLIRHFQANHGQYKDKGREFFERKAKELLSAQVGLKASTTMDKKLLKISYIVAQKICQQKMPHTIGEKLIMPCAIEIVREMQGDQKAKALTQIPISNDSVKRRISSMSADILEQCTARLRAIQLDESIDVSKMSHLLAFVRYMWENELQEEFLFCNEMRTTTTGMDVFQTLDDFVKANRISWTNCIGICTDGAAAMTGRHKGVVTRILEVAPRAVATHCFLHRETLAAKDLEPGLHAVMNAAVEVINFVKARATNSRLFTALCEEVGAEYVSLLLHTEVRWLSRGRMLTRLFNLREELCTFLSEKKPELAGFFNDEKWLLQLSYLADIFSEVNKLNKTMQGANTNNIFQYQKVEAFKRKLKLWRARTSSGITDMFENMHAFIQDRDMSCNVIKAQVILHLSKLLEMFNSYFPELTEDQAASYQWIENPFIENIEMKLPESSQSKLLEELIDLSSDGTMKTRFSAVPLESFWAQCVHEFPISHAAAMKVLLPFTTTYLCEASFSAMTAMKTKYRSRLRIEDDMRVSLSKIHPRIDNIIASSHQQVSH